MDQSLLHELVAKEAIRKVLYTYCRALDRMDRPLASTVFHPGATAHYDGIFEGTGEGFLDWVWESHAAMDRHSHQIANTVIEVDGDRATSEAYVTVVLWTRPEADGKQREIVGRGRYIDRMERRDGVWGIVHRLHLLDQSSLHAPEVLPVSEGSRRTVEDGSYSILGRASGDRTSRG